jgi:hypothetical protein
MLLRCPKTAVIGEPLDQRGDRRDIAEAEADTADDAGAKPHQPKLMDDDADAGQHEAASMDDYCW